VSQVKRDRKMVLFSRRLVIVVSIIFYYAVFTYLMVSTAFCASCSGSQLWKYLVVMSSPTWLIFFYTCLGWRTRSFAHQPHSGEFSVVLALAGLLCFAISFAPKYILDVFGQTDDIVYFDWIRFPFSSAIIVVVAVTSGMVSFNLGLAFRRESTVAKNHGSMSGSWSPVARNFSLFTGLALLIQSQIGDTNPFKAFGTLLGTTMFIPMFHPWFEKLPRKAKLLLQFIGLTPLIGLREIQEFFASFPPKPTHPLLLVALLSYLAVCLSSALGELGSYHIDLRSLRRTIWWQYTATIFLVALGILLLFL